MIHSVRARPGSILKSLLAALAAVSGVLLVTVGMLVLVAGHLVSRPQERSLWAACAICGILLLVGAVLLRLARRSLRDSRILMIGLGTVLVAFGALLFRFWHVGVIGPGRVDFNDGVLLIQGRLTRELLLDFRRVLRTSDVSNARVKLRSQGGDIYAGMAMGFEIHRRQLDVEVIGRCVSSCANYLFTAGRNKFLRSADDVLFHGGALQPDFVKNALETIEQGKQMLSGEDLPDPEELRKYRDIYGLSDDFPFNAVSAILAEKSFFETVGVSFVTPVYGQYGEFASWFDDGVHDDFYYLAEDLGLLGVHNVIVSGPVRRQRPGPFRARTAATAVNALQVEMSALHRQLEEAVTFSVTDIWRR